MSDQGDPAVAPDVAARPQPNEADEAAAQSQKSVESSPADTEKHEEAQTKKEPVGDTAADGEEGRPPSASARASLGEGQDGQDEHDEDTAPSGAHENHADGAVPGADGQDLSSMDAAALRKLVLQMRTDHEQQLQAEERARAEVEDMCLRIEKHFKAEKVCTRQADRKQDGDSARLPRSRGSRNAQLCAPRQQYSRTVQRFKPMTCAHERLGAGSPGQGGGADAERDRE
jgi:hypothetical protein